MFRRLRNRIILSFCILMVGGGTVSTMLVSRTMSRTLGTVVDRSGLALAQVLADQLREPLAYGDRLAIRGLLSGAQQANADLVYVFVTEAGGAVRNHSFPPDGFPEDLLQVSDSVRPTTLATERGRVRDLPFPVAEGILGVLHVGLSMSWVDAAIREAVMNVLMTTLAAMAAGVLGILFLAHLMTRPLYALRDAADKLGSGDTAAVAPVEGTDEITDLARTFNQMAGQIRDQIGESEALRAYVERLLDQMESAIVVVSDACQVEYANGVAREIYGPLDGETCSAILGAERPCDECPVPEVLATSTVIDRRFQAPSGRSYDLKWLPILGRDGRPAVVEHALEVTERVEFQQRFQRAQHLAVAGELAAGVVHSVNNPLDGIRRALDLAGSRPDDVERVERMLGLAREGTDRIAAVTRMLLGFARGDSVPRPIPVEVDTLIDAAVNLVRLKAEAADVIIQHQPSSGAPLVLADPQTLEEALVNLLLNSVDACAGGGAVVIEARLVPTGLEISVQDSGPGIPPEDAERVFDPFFTTKEAERGTGLGLPVARRAVEAHGGDLVLKHTPGGGATFVIRLPSAPGLEPSTREAEVV
jgi:signal transduction histidine kinase